MFCNLNLCLLSVCLCTVTKTNFFPPIVHGDSILFHSKPIFLISSMLYLPFAAVPSAPRSVISIVNETSLVLEWSDPRDLGGRDDTFYNVICKKCLPERGMCSRCDDNVDISPRHLGLTQRRVAVRNLQAHTQYSFEIQAVNGVSNKSPYTPQFSAVNITTNQAGRYCSASSWLPVKDQYRTCVHC